MAVTTRTENVEQEAPGRRPKWIGWTVVGVAVAVLIGVATVIWTGSTTEPAGITFSDVQAREAGTNPESAGITFSDVQAREAETPAPATELERFQQMSDDELRQHLVERGLIPTAAVPTMLERFQQMSNDEIRQHLIVQGLIRSAVPTELERYQQMSDDELRQHLVDRGLIPSAPVPAP